MLDLARRCFMRAVVRASRTIVTKGSEKSDYVPRRGNPSRGCVTVTAFSPSVSLRSPEDDHVTVRKYGYRKPVTRTYGMQRYILVDIFSRALPPPRLRELQSCSRVCFSGGTERFQLLPLTNYSLPWRLTIITLRSLWLAAICYVRDQASRTTEITRRTPGSPLFLRCESRCMFISLEGIRNCTPGSIPVIIVIGSPDISRRSCLNEEQ